MCFLSRFVVAGIAAACCVAPGWVIAGQLTVRLSGDARVRFVGAFHRWDQDGNPRKPVNPKAKIDVPEVDAVAQRAGQGQWVFKDLEPGQYDLVILADQRTRIEGFTYAPVLEFDPFFPPTATVDEAVRQTITDDIRKSRHYENRVEPLYMGGNQKTVRVLVMLIRDKPTSYEGIRPGAATMRFEIWQYEWRYGGWVKNRRTRVLHRVMLHRDQLRRWTWLWDPELGGIELGSKPVEIEYQVPDVASKRLKGLRPY
ncbi:MAG TPA: hypothetical protein EYP56_03540 [Planctomycetaceae bacterium]|nr:hypothetical protein [Planctomycetaceae bacterium]HIQ21554.1 hypothetical protein [Planctomycetota bacterium]